MPSVYGVCSGANTFGAYKQLKMAEIQCIAETTCIGILDDDCGSSKSSKNGKDYRLCRKGFMVPVSTGSCINQKKEYGGTY